MTEDMGCATAWANNASTAHCLGDDHRDCTVIREGTKVRS
jgi:hypothetical protein